MSKNKNQRIWSLDHEMLKRLADEQENYIGRAYKLDLDNDMLTIYALPQKRTRKHSQVKDNAQRNRKESKDDAN